MAFDKKLNTDKVEWDLSPLYSSDNDPKIEKDIEKAEAATLAFVSKWKDRKDYLEDPMTLKEALDEYEVWTKNHGTVGNADYYLALRSSQDQTDPILKAMGNKLHEKSMELYNQIQFFNLNISKIPEKTQNLLLASELLKDYKHLLERAFAEGKHTLTEPEEKILNLKAKTSLSNWTEMISEFFSKEEMKVLDSNGKETVKSFDEALSLTSNTDKKIRARAAKEIEKTFLKLLDVTEVEMNTVLENKKVEDKLRGFNRPDESRHLGDDISTEAVDVLVKAVTKGFEVPRKHYEFKASLLGQSSLDYYERAVEYGVFSKKYSYEDSIALIAETFADLDSEFLEIFEAFVENGNIDVFPRKGKRGGAFCIHHGLLEPTYILLNHNDLLSDVRTIAHEVGHGINNELIRKAQHNLNFGTPISTAEVASTFMEDFVLERLLENATEEEQLTIRMRKLDADVSTIYRQIAFYNFETDLHASFAEKGYLPKEAIGELFNRHMEAYMGTASKGSENWWTYVSHFRAYFYVYSYASGLLISKALQSKVRADPAFLSKVKEFLAAGTSDSPKNIFAKMGIDITSTDFWQQGLDEVKEYLEETISLAKKLKKI